MLENKKSLFIDIAFLIMIGVGIFLYVVPLSSTQVYGDDATLWTRYISVLSTNLFSPPSWDSCCFAGSPDAGVPWLVLYPSAIMVHLGATADAALNYSFLIFYVLLGLSVYYFAKKIGASRLVGLALPILIWTTNTQWNATIWGASYDKFFSLPFIFIVLGLAYGIISTKKLDWGKRDYLSLIAALSMSVIIDVHVTIFIFVLFSMFTVVSSLSLNFGTWSLNFGTLFTAIRRLCTLMIGVLGLTIWYTAPLLEHVFSTKGLSFIYGLIPDNWSWILGAGFTYEATLNFVYIPLLLMLVYVVLSMKRRSWMGFDRASLALTITTLAVLIYYLIEGWVPLLWPYTPRFETTVDAVAPLGFLIIMLFALLAGRLNAITSTGPSKSVGKVIGMVFIIAIAANAILVTPNIGTVNWTPHNQSLEPIICTNNSCSATSNYRIGVTGRVLERWLPTTNTGLQISDGRVAILDMRPSYTAWFDNMVFYRADQQLVSTELYFEDTPPPPPSYALTNVANVGPSMFWMDWLGVKTAFVITNVNPSNNTLAYYKGSPYFNVSTPNHGVVGFTNPLSGPIASTTNAPVVGVFVSGPDSYNMFLASLSYLGLGSSYVIPVQVVDSSGLSTLPMSSLLTDWSDYQSNQAQINTLAQSGVNIVILPQSGAPPPTPNLPHGISLESLTLTQLIQEGSQGSLQLVQQVLPHLGFTETVAIQHASGASGSGETYSTTRPINTTNLVFFTFAATTSNTTMSADSVSTTVGTGTTSVPLSQFVGNAIYQSSFNTINTNRDLGNNITIISLKAQPQSPIAITWTGSSSATGNVNSNLPTGLLWKETYSPSWIISVNGVRQNVYQAGPELMYIPLTSGGSMTASYSTAYGNWPYYILGAMSLLTIPLMPWGRKIRMEKR